MSLMSAMLRHPAAYQHRDAASKKLVGDPTGTLALRRSTMRMMDRRWAIVQREVRDSVVGNNALGLSVVKMPTLTEPFNVQAFMNLGSGQPNANKIKMFQRWFDDQLANTILMQDASYIRPVLTQVYVKAMNRAARLAGLDNPPPKTVQEIGANIDTLQQFFVIELQGIMEAASQRAVRAATEGILQRLRPAPVSRAIKAAIQTVGVVRTRQLVQALVVRAHSEGTLDTFEAAGIKQVSLLPEVILRRDHLTVDAKRKTSAASEPMVEILTAGDDDVCPVCEDLSDAGPYEIDDARGLIPAHPNCRCAFIPANDARFAPVNEDEDE